ncbi:carbohydrate ABC transporter permease [Paenactinomyces guangxiensis]|uniref:Carbohydrate ABC transporter permease n=1 Tax=Paenactinomyces guangxiensis TaxID=1490290 RepID=A0A7W1WMX2_9BACL|nr:carbohydrate ABC transporter permease [Paenactinomyces guangxiensis]MBA4492867.1 carbohydrate ABC transporter permease [Paenactinomyces guangxiensis]MBH8590284.1 carbohydrate ABC transporter permease [Paenactinomyces guangxiensis]
MNTKKTFWEKLQSAFTRFKPLKIITYIVLFAWSLTTIYPLFWVFNNSLKPSQKVITDSFSVASNPTLQNYVNAFEQINIGQSYLNSLIMSGGTVFFTLWFGGLAAYILSRFEFRLRSFIQTLLVASLLIPAFATVAPVSEILQSLDLLNTYWALILPHTAGFLPFTILVLSSYMVTIPKDLEEAAIIDGCSRWKVFTRVIVPVSRPAFATASIFVFLWSYNDLFSALIFVPQKDVQPINVLLSNVTTQYGTDYGLLATAVTLTLIPVIIIYLLAQKQVIKGLTSGAVKG